jgi:hypothetical protein
MNGQIITTLYTEHDKLKINVPEISALLIRRSESNLAEHVTVQGVS